MRALRVLLARIGGLRAKPEAEADFREEMESHLALHIEDNLRRGMSPDQARRAAVLAAGNLTAAVESVREQRGLPLLENLATDVRHMLRTLRGNPGYTAAAVLTLALGTGANTAMFTVVNAAILKPLPYPESDRILSLSLRDKDGDRGSADEPTYDEWVRSARSLTLSTTRYVAFAVPFQDGPHNVDGRMATASYFRVMGVKPALGRVFNDGEDRPGGPELMVLSDQLWRRAFGADSGVLERPFLLEDKQYTIIGVMPPSFTTTGGAQFWVPRRLGPARAGFNEYRTTLARLRPGFTIETARAELATISRRVNAERSADHRALDPVVMRLHDRRFEGTQQPLLLLFAAVGVLLLIACANLATLSLARAARRQREVALRLALGAGRGRLMRFALGESVLLAIAGAALGWPLAMVSTRVILRWIPDLANQVGPIPVDWRVLLFTTALALVTGLLFGAAPAFLARGGNLHALLSNGTPRTTDGARQRRWRSVLVVTQMATALVLLTGAGLLARTFFRVASLDLGFRPDHLLTAEVVLPRSRYSGPVATAYFADLLDRVHHISGIQSAAFTAVTPLAGISMTATVEARGKPPVSVDVVEVDPGYLETLGVRLQAGRTLRTEDAGTEGESEGAVINASAARSIFGDGNALGQRLPMGARVVGVIDDIRQRGLEHAMTPMAYTMIAPTDGRASRYLVIRSPSARESIEAAVIRAVRASDPLLVSPTFRSMDELWSDEIAPRRLTFTVLATFAALAAALAVVGLAGLLSYLVVERTREMGIRAALGADAASLRRMVVGQGMGLTATGVALGLAGSLAAVRLLQSMVFEMSVYDPWTFVASVGVLGGGALLACYLPAQKASRVDPMIALRNDG